MRHFLFVQDIVSVPLEWTITTLQLQVHRITNDYLQGIFTENKDKIILGALNALVSKDLETNSEIEAQFHALRRLVANKIGFAAFTTLPGFREAVGTKVVKALKRQNCGVTQAAIDCICALMQPMHDDCDLRQEQLNKSSLLSNNKFLESLLEMWINHIVSNHRIDISKLTIIIT
jgi:DnaJ family protein C protein 13